MAGWLSRFWQQLSLAQRFMLATLVIMLGGMVGISGWIGQQIEAGVIRQNGTTTALLLDSLVAPQLQDFGQKGALDQQHAQALGALLRNTPLGKSIVAFTVRDVSGRLLYTTDSALATLPPPTTAELSSVTRGEISSEIDRRERDTDSALLKISDRLVKTYSPVRLSDSGRIVALVEFYQDLDTLQAEIDAARRRSWYIVGGFMLGMFLLLAAFSQRVSDTIDRQKNELNRQVVRLTDLLDQNQQLHARVQRAAASVARLHERLLRRIGAELHDGPAQDLSLALMQMDTAIARSEAPAQGDSAAHSDQQLLTGIQAALQNALTELRAISSGLGLPQLTSLSLEETLAHAAHAHERRTHTRVDLDLHDLPQQLPLPIKITAYRLVQEALNNAFKHAGGAGQHVSAQGSGTTLSIEISDRGPGFDADQAMGLEDHLGLVGMRERVESLGGTFQVESRRGEGTRICAILNLIAPGGTDE